MSENEQLERHIEYVKYALDSLLVLCYLFLGAAVGFLQIVDKLEGTNSWSTGTSPLIILECGRCARSQSKC